MLIAVLMRNAKLVEELLKLGADPNKARPDGKGPLFGAVRVGEEKIVQTLLKGGAKVDAPLSMDHNGVPVGGCTALYIAALLGHLPSCKVLASNGAIVLSDDKSQQIAIMLNGAANGAMPAWKNLSDTEIAAVVTYTKNSWSNKTGQIVQPADITAARK